MCPMLPTGRLKSSQRIAWTDWLNLVNEQVAGCWEFWTELIFQIHSRVCERTLILIMRSASVCTRLTRILGLTATSKSPNQARRSLRCADSSQSNRVTGRDLEDIPFE